MFRIFLLYTFIIGIGPFIVCGQPASSVLSKGEWIKIGVVENGIYRIDRSMLESAGFSLSGIDPQKLQLFGNGGKMLPQSNSAPRFTSLTQNAILVTGEDDGVFDDGDAVLFYGQQPHSVTLNENTGLYSFENNLYSDTTFYFLTAADSDGLRVASRPDAGTGDTVITRFDDYRYHEKDLINFITSGREWFGERVGSQSQAFDFEFEGLVANSALYITSAVMGRTFESAQFSLSLNGTGLGIQEIDPVSTYIYGTQGRTNTKIFSTEAPFSGNELTLSLSFSSPGGSGYLNYFFIQGVRELRMYGQQTIFRSIRSIDHDFSTYRIGSVSGDLKIWDITDPLVPLEQAYSVSNDIAEFSTETSIIRKFIAFNPSWLLSTPVSLKQIPNQDLHGFTTPDLLIITHPAFMSEANRLAELRRNYDGLRVQVATTRQVYNEFSSGSQDITAIRDFVKYLYTGDSNTLKYVLLFGRASIDYKNINKPNTNFVPTYQSRNSLHKVLSYASDDYYTFMDDNEGTWNESFSGDHTMDVSVGRVPVTTIEEAKAVVDKLIHYTTSRQSLGAWRNDVYFVADDGDDTDGTVHQRQADEITEYIDTTLNQLNVRKIYVDGFPQVAGPGGETAPEVNEAINKAVSDGALIINFTGHGGERQWTQENILNLFMIDQWENIENLPLFVTATCEFGRFDNPSLVSGGEKALFNPKGGAIALVTTTRPVASSTNFILNKAFYKAALEKVNGEFKRLGDIFRDTKNNSLNGSSNRNFSLLGDPSMRLAFPAYGARITHLNETSLMQGSDTLSALAHVQVRAEIYNPSNGEVLSSFDGLGQIEVFDKKSVLKTLGNRTPIMEYLEWENEIFRGEVSVTAGAFDFEFIVPKNISYQIDKAKFSIYAESSGNLTDAGGANTSLFIGGSENNVIIDSTPPQIELYIGDTTFLNGGITDPNTLLIAKLTDESGINISTSGLGQTLTATLDDETEYTLSDYYTASRDDFRTGWVTFPLHNLSKGEHTVRLKAFDIHNNGAEAFINFRVTEEHDLVIENLINFPNPFFNQTTFMFDHNRSGEDLEVKLAIYSVKGEIVKEILWKVVDSSSRLQMMTWDGRNTEGKKVNRGVYVSRLIVRSLKDGAKTQQYRKIVLIN